MPEGIPADRAKEWQRNDGHNDAARHAYFSAVMTRGFGESFAREFGTAHEARPGNPADREAMDLYNNEVGRRIALEHPGASDEELAGYVQQAAENGELLVIDGNGNLAWSDQVAYGRHGLQNDPAIPGGPKAEAGARPDSSPS